MLQNPFPANSFKKYKIKSNPKMCILNDQPRIARNVFKRQNFSLK